MGRGMQNEAKGRPHSEGFFLTGVDTGDCSKPKATKEPKEKPRRRRSTDKRKDPNASWLSELQAMHRAVGNYTGEQILDEEESFFSEAKRTEAEVDKICKEVCDET